MTEQTTQNPYILQGPVHLERLFFGQEAVFAWMRSNLEAVTGRQWMAMFGPPRSGKSSILTQVSVWGRLGEKVLPILVDVARLQMESPASFYRSLAETAVAALRQQEINLPDPDPASYIERPRHTFDQQLLQPILALCAERKPFFLFDNIEEILPAIDRGDLPVDSLHSVALLLQEYKGIYALFALAQSDDQALRQALSFLHQADQQAVPPLSLAAAAALIRQPVSYTVVQDVVQYIYELTDGQPWMLQIYGHALYERQAAQNLRTITVADVVAVRPEVRKTLSAAQRATNTPAESALPAYALRGADMVRRSGHPRPAAGRRRYGLWLLLLVLVLVLSTAVVVWWQGAADPPDVSADVAAVPPTQVVTMIVPALVDEATATPTPTETAVLPSSTATPSPEPSPTPEASATPSVTPWPTRILREIDDMPMVYVPAGTFLMGSNPADVMAGEDELPQHQVRLDAFYIDRYEVSVRQYAAFLNELGGYFRACSRQDCTLPRERVGFTNYLMEETADDGTVRFIAMAGFEDYPANHISWFGAAAYCEYVGGRLPTEAEWEYAARGTDGRIYPWGDDPPNAFVAVFMSQSYNDLKPVDALVEGASPFGALNMAGSMWEWTADWYDATYYQRSATYNPQGPSTGLTKTARGGAWPNNNEADRIRAANRLPLDPSFISSTVGFRCVQSP